ncbi:MAG: LarC family nickel insertion protein [Tractidigestivibacter sp.]|jgi:uncharacterized protein (TIGR00299 family) protein|uniref:LarC family nickel insertion protein n=1 Tax=Tractidigestivibacter sp. TaxID=2847320 RepID=UPI003D8C9A6F
MGKTLYLDCACGISGDMVAGALLDLGANEDGLRRALASLDVAGFEIRVSRKSAGALDACDFDVVLDEEHDGHDHDMAYLYGGLGEGLAPKGLDAPGTYEGECRHHDERHHGKHHHHHEHDHGHEERDRDLGHDGHDHDHDGHGHHHHEHRGPAEVARIIDAADLAPRARATAHKIFDILAQAEAHAHGVPVSEVHFHEVGAVDSIVDVVAVAYCLDDLDVDNVIVSPLAEGEGRVRAAHGVLSVPVPAVLNIVSEHGLVLECAHQPGELVTPTGAAIAAAVRTEDALPDAYRVARVGVGAGKRAYDPPSTLRAMIVEPVELRRGNASEASQGDEGQKVKPELWQLETEVDDCTGEALGHAFDALLAAGAREVHLIPCYMKKMRPGTQIQVICAADKVSELERVLFEETTTIGVRRIPLWRTALSRKRIELSTPYGPAAGKQVTLPDGSLRTYPEHDSVVALAGKAGISYIEALRAVENACSSHE